MRAERTHERAVQLPGSDLPVRALLLLLLALAVGSNARAQDRPIVSTAVSVSSREASLRIEFDAGSPLEIALEEGTFRIDGESIGPSTAELETAWRALLSRAVTLEDGALAKELRDWSPRGLRGDAAYVGERIDVALEGALAGQPVDARAALAPAERAGLTRLLSNPQWLADLSAVVEDADLADVRLYVGEDAHIRAGERVTGSVVVIDADLDIEGEIDGSVIALNATVRLNDVGRITGDVRVLESNFERNDGELVGNLVQIDRPAAIGEAERENLRDELLHELRSEMDSDDSRRASSFFSPVRYFVGGVTGLLSSLLAVCVLIALGAGVRHFTGSKLEIVADTARKSPARAAAVGLAGVFLSLPVWILGTAALAISIIGIPLALVWIFVFPIAAALALLLGYYAVARNVGGWVARQRYPYFGWARASNSLTLIAAGVIALSAAFIASATLQVGGPWLAPLRAVVTVAGVLVTILAFLVGFGAVLITRAGRRTEFYTGFGFFDSGWDYDLGDSGSPAPPPGPDAPPEWPAEETSTP
jgi:hypothetical protein